MVFNVKGHTIELYDSTQSLPILRFQKFNKYMMMASEVGNTFEDYDARMAKALSFLQKEMTTEAIKELNNQRLCVFNAYNEFTPKGNAFAVLVKSIDEKCYGDNIDKLDDVLKHLDNIGLSYYDSIEKLEEVKKKSN